MTRRKYLKMHAKHTHDESNRSGSKPGRQMNACEQLCHPHADGSVSASAVCSQALVALEVYDQPHTGQLYKAVTWTHVQLCAHPYVLQHLGLKDVNALVAVPSVAARDHANPMFGLCFLRASSLLLHQWSSCTYLVSCQTNVRGT